ncbi:MAG: amidohydrolase family protein [Acidimicrobiales bacterium]
MTKQFDTAAPGRQPVYTQRPLEFSGAIDADGHVLEPATLWEDYLEDKYQDRAIRLLENEDGLEYFVWDGQPWLRGVPGVPGLLGTMGDPDAVLSPERKYMEYMPFGACDPAERLALLDDENIERALLYPTLALLWECEVPDPELSNAYMRAYNRWLADFCRDSGGRLVGIAHISLSDIDRAVVELRRAADDGLRGAYVAPFTHTRKSQGHPDHDPFWAVAQELDIPVGIHPTYEPRAASPLTRFDDFPDVWSSSPNPNAASWFYNTTQRLRIEQAFLSFFAHGTFDRFPRLKIGVLESGCGWIGALLDRMDTVYETGAGTSARGDASLSILREKPSFYFRRQCFISGDPDETAAPYIMDHVGIDRFMWATDYPHPDHSPDYIEALTRFLEPLSDESRSRVLGQNVIDVYNL